ncbi:hypothetical protein SDC9_203789 [bioreactor metagenome]|uniref:Uncharacterized protein n=1 Tax=bioreactor metagenome TaxID=1076179 RepID=A0A645J9B6_9ZZZZ
MLDQITQFILIHLAFGDIQNDPFERLHLAILTVHWLAHLQHPSRFPIGADDLILALDRLFPGYGAFPHVP